MIVRDNKGAEWPVADLKSCKRLANGQTAAVFGSGDQVLLSSAALDRALAMTVVRTLPADRGTMIIKARPDDETSTGVHFWEEAAFAWAVNMAGDTHPVTLQGIDLDYVAVLRPDGSVEQAKARFATLEAFKASYVLDAARTPSAGPLERLYKAATGE